MSFPRRAIAPAILIVFTLAFYRKLGLGGQFLLSFDALGYFTPHLVHLGEALRSFHLPLWDSYLFGGAPFLANSQTGVLYPPNWLAVLISAPRAYAWLVVGHAALGAIGAYLFARRALGLGCAGALATALVFEFAGWPVAQTGHLNQFEAVAWLPFALLVFDRLLRVPGARMAVLGGVLLALQFLAGHSQTLYLTAWVLALYVVWVALGRLLEARRSAESRRKLPAWLGSRALAFAGVGLVAVGLSAPQLLPTLELSSLSIRAGGLDYSLSASFSMRPFLVLQGLLPTYGEAPINSEWLGYVGLTGLLLVGTALAIRPDRRVVGMLLVALLGLGLAFGQFTPLFRLAYRFVPGIDLFRVPARWLFVYTSALAGLVGVGLDSLARASVAGGPPSARVDRPPAIRVVLVVLALLAGLGALLAAYQRLAPAGYPLVFPGTLTIEVWAATVVLGVALVILAIDGPSGSRQLAPAALLALLAAELVGASLMVEVNWTGPDDAATAVTPEVSFLQAQARSSSGAPFRILGIGSRNYQLADQQALAASLSPRYTAAEVSGFLASVRNRQMETPNIPLTFGLSTIDGYDGGVLPLQRYLGLKSLFPEEGENVFDGRLWVQLKTAPDPKLLGWLNVRYLILDRSVDVRSLPPDYRLVYDGDARVYENIVVLPRAYVVGRVRTVADDRAALEALKSPDFDARSEAVVTAEALRAAGIQPQVGQSTQVQMVSYSDERVVVEADLSAPGLLVLTDVNYPGWRAVVDGAERPIATTDYLFRGIWLDAGKHRIEYRFEPASFSRGLLIAAVTALVSLALLVLGPRLDRQVARLG